MHLHGHNFYVLHEGPGAWDGTIVRPTNPTRRDVQIVRPYGHLVIQFDGHPGEEQHHAIPLQANAACVGKLIGEAGVWAFHCHVAWHASGGFFSSLIVQSKWVAQMEIPRDVEGNCKAWDLWTKHHIVEQIDSGT
jgi:FtsP/CotA-like multicopper oxidase with cupredoxin domain